MNSKYSSSWNNSADCCEPKLKRRYSVLRLLQSLQNSMLHQWRRPRLRNAKLYDGSVSPQKPHVRLLLKLKLITEAQQRLHEPPRRPPNARGDLPQLLRRL